MDINIYQVDAFASSVFKGNPAAVCPLNNWLPDEVLQQIAEENNLSETAFFVLEAEHTFSLRWFTPEDEVDLCGHATLAAAHVIYHELGYESLPLTFRTKSGDLVVEKSCAEYVMDFPASLPEKITPPQELIDGLGVSPSDVLAAYDYIVVLNNQDEIKSVKPDYSSLSKLDRRGVVITAKGDEVDFVSRCFYPKLRVNEDPVTGSAHCILAPYWAQQLEKESLTAQQLSKRSGLISIELIGERVILKGEAVTYLKGLIHI